jgi:predicted Ser/Thr protein kinase
MSRSGAASQELSSELQRFVDRFEEAWQAGQRPRIDDYLPPEGADRPSVLIELMHVDLERRLKAGEAVRVEQYLERYPELAADQAALLNLLASEFVLRQRGEPDLSREEYLRRFPALYEALLRRIHEISLQDTATHPQDLDSVAGQGPGQERVAPLAPAAGGDGLEAGRGWFIGKYRLVEKLGGGGQGEIYRAVHPVLGRDVAIKVARADLPEAARQLLLIEGRVLAQVDDPGVVRVFDVDLHEGRPFVVLEYVAGRSLAERLKQERLPFRETAALVAALAETLARLHQKGVLHRDLKPANVLIDAAGRPRLLDFGLSSLAQHWTAINRPTPGVLGTPAYMAPEQANGLSNRIGPRTDIFNLGALLYELLTGRPPYQGVDSIATWQQARTAQISPPSQLNPRIPRSLERVCLKALAADPGQRYASARRMARVLRSYLRRPRRIALTGSLLFLAVAGIMGLARAPFAAIRTDIAGSAEPVEIRSFVVSAWSDEGADLGEVGVLARKFQLNYMVSIRAEFNRPAFCFLLAFKPDAQDRELCFPCTPDNDPAPEEPPAPIKELRYPIRSPEICFKLEEGMGLYAFVLLASSKPLPPYARWKQQVGAAPWQRTQGLGIWRFNGKEFETGSRSRKPRELNALPRPLVELCHFLRDCPGIEAQEVIAFPVNPPAPERRPR